MADGSRVQAMGRALRHRNFRLYFFGQGTSLVGNWLTRVATSWLVFRLTGSALLLGVVGFAGQLPNFVLAPLGGVLVDRWDRHRVLLVTQALSMVQSGLLAWYTLRGTIGVVHIVLLAIMQGLINALDTPARQSFVVEMVDAREDLPNAIALNSTMVNSARLIGPAVAALLVAAFGEGWCFALDALTYVAVLGSLYAMRLPRRQLPARVTHVLGELAEGWRYVVRSPAIRSLLLMLALVSFTGVPSNVLMPIFAAQVYGGGPHTLGILMAATGLGALIGALWLAARASVIGLGRVIVAMAALFGVSLIGFSEMHRLAPAAGLLVLGGMGMMVQTAASNTLLQTIVDEDKRGRVMSFYTAAFFGMQPLGSLAAGWLGARIGAPRTVMWGGIVMLVGTIAFAFELPRLREAVRPIYRRLGILPGD